MLVPPGLRFDELADGTERQWPLLADANLHAARRNPGAHAPAVHSDPDDSDADGGRHRHAPHRNADFRTRVDADYGDADAGASDTHSDRSGYPDALHARAHEHAVRGHADTDASLIERLKRLVSSFSSLGVLASRTERFHGLVRNSAVGPGTL